MTTYSSKSLSFVDTDATWKKIVALYQSGEVSISQLAERFHLTYEGVRFGLKQRKVLESRQLKRKGH